MSRIVYDGRIHGEFRGFGDGVLFKMGDGTYWVQTQYQYWYYYEYRPAATITEENRQYILTVAGHSVPVKRVKDVIESRIDGSFEGWNGKSSYKLQNSQVWKQRTYKYEYTYAYMPEVIVYNSGSGIKMLVAGTIADVERVK
jgi:hypothetical protein